MLWLLLYTPQAHRRLRSFITATAQTTYRNKSVRQCLLRIQDVSEVLLQAGDVQHEELAWCVLQARQHTC